MVFDGNAYNELFHADDTAGAPTKVYVKPKKETAQESESAVYQATDQDAAEHEYDGAGDPPEEEIETEGGEE